MKKVLLAFDGSHFSEGALEFARQLNGLTPILLTGAFLPQIDYSGLWSHSGGGKSGSMFIPLVEDEDTAAVAANIKKFEDFCTQHKIEFRVHKDFFDMAVPGLKKETRFADLLVVSSETFYEQAGTAGPNDYLKELLRGVECPVLLVPETYAFPRYNILAYDGSSDSVFAIKQFAYLFPELAARETLLVHCRDKEDEPTPDEPNIRELAARHFPKLDLQNVEGASAKEFREWMQDKPASVVVTGAFGRSGLSRIFHKSFAADIIRDHRVPVFIAHR